MSDISATELAQRVGPNMLQLDEVAVNLEKFETEAVYFFADGRAFDLEIKSRGIGQGFSVSTTLGVFPDHETVSQGLLKLVSNMSSNFMKSAGGDHGHLLPTYIKVKSSKTTLESKELKDLVVMAWCEAFAVDVPTEEDIQKKEQMVKDHEKKLSDQCDARAQAMLAELRGGPAGIKAWNQRSNQGGTFKRVDLQNADLTDVSIAQADFQSSNFDRANLEKAYLKKSDFRKATFKGASLQNLHADRCKFSGCDLSDASLVGAWLSDSTFNSSNLQNVDFSGATLYGCDLSGADLSTTKFSAIKKCSDVAYDEKTKWPGGEPPEIEGLKWKGTGKNPVLFRKTQANVPSGPIDFQALLATLEKTCDKERLTKVLKMLKSERFQLFTEVTTEAVVGIVKSQTDPELFYSCRLTKEGAFSCCTQNLNACGGLRGALCKHLLLLLIGLTRAGQLDPTSACNWAVQSQAQRPDLDRDVASSTFLRYKGAEAGELDWRPTETIPEDYYVF